MTFLFSDIEGSTRLARQLDADQWARLPETDDRPVDEAVQAHDGTVVKHEDDGALAAFRIR